MNQTTIKSRKSSRDRITVDPIPEVCVARGPISTWFRSMWRPTAALVYFAICIFDFIIAPYYINARPTDLSETFHYIFQMPIDQQSEALRIMYDKTQWVALTLQGGGIFHIAFGAILGATAWTRGLEKREAIAVRKWQSGHGFHDSEEESFDDLKP